jgi:transposase
MARGRRLFSEEFKREAVKLVNQPGASKAGIARDLGLGANLLGRWCREASGEQPASNGGVEKVSS